MPKTLNSTEAATLLSALHLAADEFADLAAKLRSADFRLAEQFRKQHVIILNIIGALEGDGIKVEA